MKHDEQRDVGDIFSMSVGLFVKKSSALGRTILEILSLSGKPLHISIG